MTGSLEFLCLQEILRGPADEVVGVCQRRQPVNSFRPRCSPSAMAPDLCPHFSSCVDRYALVDWPLAQPWSLAKTAARGLSRDTGLHAFALQRGLHAWPEQMRNERAHGVRLLGQGHLSDAKRKVDRVLEVLWQRTDNRHAGLQ